MSGYILGIDQSTQGTKAILFDEAGALLHRVDAPHKQYIDERGWVEHDPEEIFANLKHLVGELLQVTGIDPQEVRAVGISNQRETAVAWDRQTGKPLCRAIVWQCARGEKICERIARSGVGERIRFLTGLPLSPYFSAAKLAWVLENIPEAKQLAEDGHLAFGTMDSYLVFRLTGGHVFATDASNASRTQLFDIEKCGWSEEACDFFGIPVEALPRVMDSDAIYGETDFDGVLPCKIPIHAVLGDSHAALFGQGCHVPGMTKATYGTGSSVMMHVGDHPVRSRHGLASSLAWQIGGEAEYVLEGNINYTGASVTWLRDSLQLVAGPAETEALARKANPEDISYFVPAFTGLGAPYWASEATGLFTGITRRTGRAEMVRAVLDSIAYQIGDVVKAMREESGHSLSALRVDGGATKNRYLMQFQADILEAPVEVAAVEELSALGTAYLAGIAAGLYEKDGIFSHVRRETFSPSMTGERRRELEQGWERAIRQTLSAAASNQ